MAERAHCMCYHGVTKQEQEQEHKIDLQTRKSGFTDWSKCDTHDNNTRYYLNTSVFFNTIYALSCCGKSSRDLKSNSFIGEQTKAMVAAIRKDNKSTIRGFEVFRLLYICWRLNDLWPPQQFRLFAPNWHSQSVAEIIVYWDYSQWARSESELLFWCKFLVFSPFVVLNRMDTTKDTQDVTVISTESNIVCVRPSETIDY